MSSDDEDYPEWFRRRRKDQGAEALIGPVLRSEAVNVDNSELYLLDGTYLGTLNQLRQL